MILTILLSALAAATAVFGLALAVTAWRRWPAWPSLEGFALGAVVNFFDTLGIGCFAPTTAYLKFRRLVPDELIPATMMAGMALPAAAEGFIFIHCVKADPPPRVLAISASVVG